MTVTSRARLVVTATVLICLIGLAMLAYQISTTAQVLSPVVDYKGLTADKDKLAACYSLLEDMRLRHNSQAADFRARLTQTPIPSAWLTDGTLNLTHPEVQLAVADGLFVEWAYTGYMLADSAANSLYRDKYRAYAADSKELTNTLLAEIDRLTSAIKDNAWTSQDRAEFEALEESEQIAALQKLLGNSTAAKLSPTTATAAVLDELRGLVWDAYEPVPGYDPIEDFTTYTDYDEGGDLTDDANTIRIDDAETCSDTFYYYYDYGTNHFDGTWEHLFETVFNATDTNATIAFGVVSDTAAIDRNDADAGTADWLGAGWHLSSDTYLYFFLDEIDAGAKTTQYAQGMSHGTRYYLEFEKTSAGTYGTIYLYICEDDYWDDGGTQIDSLSIALGSTPVGLDYSYAVASNDNGNAGRHATGWVENLDLQETSPPTVVTSAATSVEDTTATLNGEVTDINDSTIDDRGFAWGTSSQSEPDSSTAPASAGYDSYWTEAGNFGATSFNHGITSLNTATRYYFRAAANNSLAYWGWGDELWFLTKPAAPTAVTATDGVHTDKVVVTWTKTSGNVTGYKIYRDAGLIDTVGDVATYDDTAADAPTITPGSGVASDGTYGDKVNLSVSGDSANVGTTHTYKVRAYNAAGDSDDSATDTGYRGVGSLTYQWYVSWNCTGGNYSQIGGGTTDPYDYMNAPAPTITANNATACDGCSGVHVTLSCNETTADGTCNYYLAELSATGASSQNSTSDSGYKGATAQTFQWWRSWNATAGNYSQIAGGTTDPYNDTGGATTPDYRWYLTTISMTGATSVNSSADSGYMSGVNVTAVYVYPAYDQEPTSTNQSVWCIVWDDEGLGVGYNVSWNTSGVGSILWCENWTGADGRADLICTSNVTGNQTICAESNGLSDCGLTVWTQGTGEELPVWYFVLLGCAIVGAWYTKDIILFIMGIIASGGMIYWVEQSSLDDRIRYSLIAVFVILAGVLLLQMLIRGQFSFVRGGDSE